jgi:SAM-dependent methyltransferase
VPRPALPAFDADRELAELREYLGDEYDHSRIENWQEQLDEEAAEVGDEATLYRVSRGYLYNLTVFAVSRTKLPYIEDLVAHVPPGARLLDYGCGIGSDGLYLLEAGYRVEFADFANPSTEYLRWRLERRGLEAPVHDLDQGPPPAGFDAAYAFDVIEHVDDPFGFLGAMERCARLVMVNLLEPAEDETELHRDLPIDAVLAHARRRRLLSYRRYWARSHTLLYRSEPGGAVDRLASLGPFARGRLDVATTRWRKPPVGRA